MKTRKGILFDLFGTLFCYGDPEKSWTDWVSSIHSSLMEHGLCTDLNELSGYFNNFFSIPPGSANSGYTKYERRLSRVFTELGFSAHESEMRRIANKSIKSWTATMSPEPGLKNILEILGSSASIALVSNFDHAPAVYDLLKTNGLLECFDVITVSGEIDIDKPDPRIFYHTLEKLKLNADEVVHIGDTDADIDGANAAGIIPVLIDRNFTDSLSGDYIKERMSAQVKERKIPAGCRVIRSLSELPELDLGSSQSS